MDDPLRILIEEDDLHAGEARLPCFIAVNAQGRSVHDPEVVAQLYRVDNTERAAAMFQDDLEDTAVESFQGLGDVRLATLRGDGEGAQRLKTRARRKSFEVAPCRFHP